MANAAQTICTYIQYSYQVWHNDASHTIIWQKRLQGIQNSHVQIMDPHVESTGENMQ